MRRIGIIGLGGIGSIVAPFLARHLNYGLAGGWTIVLVDGDSYEERNGRRQLFSALGGKAEVQVRDLAPRFTGVDFLAIPEFVTEENAGEVVREGDTVFLGVDNHRTRKVVSGRCERLDNVTLISGGNELTDGNVQVFMRRGGKDITPPLTHLHPEIANAPKVALGTAPGCPALAEQGQTQLLLTNLGAAYLMLVAFYAIETGGKPPFDEAYFDIMTGETRSVNRSGERN